MSQPLSTAEKQTLQQLGARIDTVVAQASPQALLATGALPGAADGSPSHVVLHRRFQRLGARLKELADLVVVRADLPAATGARAVVTQGSEPVVLRIEVGPELVGPEPAGPAAQPSTHRVLALVRELSRTLDEGAIHPVKDYAHRASWAWGYLSPDLAASNADGYAGAAAVLAERIEERPGRYRVPGRVPAQREVLRAAADVSDLGPALARAALVLHRARLRSDDSAALARDESPNGGWPAQERAWRAEPGRAALLQLEELLRAKGIVGPRHPGRTTTGLSGADRRTVRQIHAYCTDLSRALDDLEPVPVALGHDVTYDAASGVLKVPFIVTGEGAAALGERIVAALVRGADARGPQLAAFTGNRRLVLDWLLAHDRPIERAALRPLLQQFADDPRPVDGPRGRPQAGDRRGDHPDGRGGDHGGDHPGGRPDRGRAGAPRRTAHRPRRPPVSHQVAAATVATRLLMAWPQGVPAMRTPNTMQLSAVSVSSRRLRASVRRLSRRTMMIARNAEALMVYCNAYPG
ncbi:hypothetical protein ACWGB8_11915 [Kitasatospora sp. NPDC054939]